MNAHQHQLIAIGSPSSTVLGLFYAYLRPVASICGKIFRGDPAGSMLSIVASIRTSKCMQNLELVREPVRHTAVLPRTRSVHW